MEVGELGGQVILLSSEQGGIAVLQTGKGAEGELHY